MKIACVGGGPAGLYFSILMKRQDPDHDITVHERNPAGSTYGWGVTYWGSLLDKLHDGDPESATAVREHSVRWSDGVAHVGDRTTRHHGDEGFGIGRHRLLDLLAERARSLGVRVEYEDEIAVGAEPPDADLVVAGDGVHSGLRERHAGPLRHRGRPRPQQVHLARHHARSSTRSPSPSSRHRTAGSGATPTGSVTSTAPVSSSAPPTPGRASGSTGPTRPRDSPSSKSCSASCSTGTALIGRANSGGAAQWLNFRTLTNRTWSHGNVVLLGDAAHTTHYSIGAGTTLALEDALALADALGEQPATAARPRRVREGAQAAPCPCRARPGTAPSGTRTCRATSACRPRRCSPCWVSATRRCCRTSRRSSTTAWTGRPDGWSRCAGSSAGWGRGWRGPCRRREADRSSTAHRFGENGGVAHVPGDARACWVMDRDRSNAALSLSRRQLLAAAGAAGAVTAVGAPPAAALPRTELSLSFTAATNGSATLAPGGDRLIAEIQNVLWSLPRTGGKAAPLTPADPNQTGPLRPRRQAHRLLRVPRRRLPHLDDAARRLGRTAAHRRALRRPRPGLVARRHPPRLRLRARR